MIERMPIPQAPMNPADNPGSGGGKRDERPQPKKRSFLGRALKSITKEGRRTLRQERSAEQRAKEAREHLRPPEELRQRLKEFDAALYYVKSPDRAVTSLISLLYKKARKLKLPKAGDEKDRAERGLHTEAQQYLFSGLMPRGEELVDALSEEERGKKSNRELLRMRQINDRTVRRHVQKYLEWRWAEQDWKDRWDAWHKNQVQKKGMPTIHPSASFPKWQDDLNRWIELRNEHKRQNVQKEPPRPPTPPEQLLILQIAKRVGEDHTQWKVTPIKPAVAT